MKERFTNSAKILLDIQQKIKYLRVQEQKEAIRLREICDHKTTDLAGYKYLRIERRGSVKYSAIPELKKIDLDKYRGDAVTSWKLSFQEQFDNL